MFVVAIKVCFYFCFVFMYFSLHFHQQWSSTWLQRFLRHNFAFIHYKIDNWREREWWFGFWGLVSCQTKLFTIFEVNMYHVNFNSHSISIRLLYCQQSWQHGFKKWVVLGFSILFFFFIVKDCNYYVGLGYQFKCNYISSKSALCHGMVMFSCP